MPIHFNLEGTPNSPVLVFSNSLGTDLSMWDEVVPYLLPYFRILRYDTRGMGQSEISKDPYTLSQLGGDIIRLLDELGTEKFSFCGLSMGGLIGQWLGIHHTDRLEKLILCNTAARIGTEAAWNDRIHLLREEGMPAILENSMRIWFTEEFRKDHPERMRGIQERFLQNSVLGYINCCAAIRDADFREQLDRITVKTLVVTGSKDPVTMVKDARFLVERLPDAEMEVLPVKHMTSMEQPAALAELLVRFLVGPSVFERGMHVRRTVLGNAHVDRAEAGTNSFNADFQNFISHYAWGEIWTRPDLSKPQRSMITLAMLIALNRQAEFRMHVRAAIHNGVTVREIRELILHSGLYCGLPAANEAFKSAQEVLQEMNLMDQI